MISVLVPSRGRAQMLKDSVISLIKTANNMNDIQVLCRIDKDDPEYGRYLYNKAFYPEFCFLEFSAGNRYGYRELHKYINELAEKAFGDWLMLWNDDCLMKTQGWDRVIRGYDHTKPCVLNLYGQGMNLFPVMSKKMYEVLGHYSQSPHNDSYATDVAHFSDCHLRVQGVAIDHLRDGIDDQTKRESQPVYGVTSPEYYSKGMQDLVQKDAEKVKGWYKSNG